jgi:hypothetical protein
MTPRSRRPHSTTPEQKAAYAAREGNGYCNPPESGQFKKDDGRLRPGRPKDEPNFDTALKNALATTVTLTENGKTRPVSKMELFVIGLVNDAVRAKDQARRLLFAMLTEIERKKDKAPPAPDEMTPEDEAALEALMEHMINQRQREGGAS